MSQTSSLVSPPGILRLAISLALRSALARDRAGHGLEAEAEALDGGQEALVQGDFRRPAQQRLGAADVGAPLPGVVGGQRVELDAGLLCVREELGR